jgi:hypothetical protein
VFHGSVSLEEAFIAIVWVFFAIYGLSVLFWLVEVVWFARSESQDDVDIVYGPDDIQIRILTIDSEAVVQATVDSISLEFDDVRVIAEAPISIQGAEVHVVPDEFECRASHKGRAVEWARRNVPCSKDFVCYLDEDTLVTRFDGLPEADVIQLTEAPLYTGSWLTYMTEIFRIGYQVEQRAFPKFRYPLYAWGGGIAIRKALEDEITWDSPSITEDTDFVWRAWSKRSDLRFRVLNTKWRNQAPPSVRGMIRQRRRWISGTRDSLDPLPWLYRAFVTARVIIWGLSPIVPIVSMLFLFYPRLVPTEWYYVVGSIAQLAVLGVIMAIGIRVFREYSVLGGIALILTYPLMVLNSIGAIWGFLKPVKTFEVTEKVDPEVIEEVHPDLEDHDLEGPVPVELEIETDD